MSRLSRALLAATALAITSATIQLPAQAQQNPLDAIKGAWKKAKEDAQRAAPQAGGEPASSPGVRVTGDMPATAASPTETARLAAAAGFIDVAGVKLGSPLGEAKPGLQGVNPKFKFFVDNEETVWPNNQPPPNAPRTVTHARAEWVHNSNSESFNLFAAAYPNPHVIIGIERRIQYAMGTGPNIDNIVAGLRKKYDPESTLGANLPKETWRATWFFDERGQVLRGNLVNQLAGCGGLGTQSPTGLCATLTVLNAGIDTDSAGTVISMFVAVQSNPLSRSAEETKQAFLQKTDEDLRKRQQQESSQRQAPKL